MRTAILAASALILTASTAVSAQRQRLVRDPGAPVVTRVSDGSVTLVAGGNSVPLTVEGTNLGAASVRFHSGGRAVAGLQASLTQTARSAVRLDLTATSAVPAGTYQMDLVVSRLAVRVPTEVTVIPPNFDFRPPAQAIGTVEIRSPSITSATPTSVTLEKGAAAQTVVVTGTWLSHVRDAYLERSGRRVYGIRAEVLSSTSGDRREVRLTALAAGSPPIEVPLDLVLEAGTGSKIGAAVAVPTPVKVTVATPVLSITADDLFANPIKAVLANAQLSFNSCGGTAAERRFMLSVPGGSYSASGDVPRHERTASASERVAFLEAHSLTPNDVFRPDQFANLAKSGHPSPFPHSVTGVRMCLRSMRGAGSWVISALPPTKVAGPHLMIEVTYQRAFFLGRGMPAAPGGVPNGINLGIGWGADVTDNEVPDLVYSRPTFEISIPITVSGGRVSYGTASVTHSGAAPKWSATFFGPSSARTLMEQYAKARIQQVAQELTRAFNATNTRNAISASIMAALQNHGINEVVSIQHSKSGWGVAYR